MGAPDAGPAAPPPIPRGIGRARRAGKEIAGAPRLLYRHWPWPDDFGPGDPTQSHQPNEHTTIDELVACTKAIAVTISKWTSLPKA